jgi:hypothetical protein
MMALLVRIQARFRGLITRNKVRSVKVPMHSADRHNYGNYKTKTGANIVIYY